MGQTKQAAGLRSLNRATDTLSTLLAQEVKSLNERQKAARKEGTPDPGLMKGLKSASGYLRHELGQKVDLRYTPELQFILDDSIAHGAHILDLLHHVKPANPANADIVLPEDWE